MKKMEIALLAGLLLSLAAALWQAPFSAGCEELRANTLRLHVVANSDSERDQAEKLLVRDSVLEELADSGAQSLDEATLTAAIKLGAIENAAEARLAADGLGYGAQAYLTEMYFPTRRYGRVTLPAGVYRAVRLELGEAEGKNWWCVIYPSLCLPAAAGERELLESCVSKDAASLALSQGWEPRFKIEEYIESLKLRLSALLAD